VAALFTLWSANGAMKALFMAMNVASDETETRGFFLLTALTLGFTVAGIVLLVVVLNAIVFIPFAFEYAGVSVLGRFVGTVLPSLLLFLLLLAAISGLYRFGASRRRPRWRWVSVGAVGATLLVIAASAGFSFYLSRWGNYGATYGSLGTAMALMMWIYLTTFIVVAGAELNAEIEHQTARDTTVGPDRPVGDRGAFVADTVGETP
jgi:membrane protein